MSTNELIDRMKAALRTVHGNRLKGIVLYGSEARGQARSDSDIDVLVLLEDMADYGKDLRANIDALYDLSLELGRRISPKPVAAREYEELDCPLYRRAHEEGIAA